MKKLFLCFMTVIMGALLAFAGCAPSDTGGTEQTPGSENGNQLGGSFSGIIPQELAEIPSSYYSEADEQGTLVELYYDTYESFSYEERSQPLNKRAIVYLPYGYSDENEYNVMYMMHGGWSNETTTLGTPSRPSAFKNVIDNAIQNGTFAPLIIVCPTYNNTNQNGQDSDNYSLALQLTRNYHNELVNDLIPAVEGKYSSYAASTSAQDLIAARDHRAFMGFSMGSVTTWRTFEYCLDYFRYFFPSSGAITSSGDYMDNIVENSGYSEDDFFIWGMSGTDDFAYSQFTAQMNAMFEAEHFTRADSETEGNIAYTVKQGYSHDTRAQREYFYNALCWVWSNMNRQYYTADTPITDVVSDPIFGEYGRLIFPVNGAYYGGDTLGDLSMTWYNHIDPNKTVEICNYLKAQAVNGQTIFYDIYTDAEKAADPSLANTGLFFFRGNTGAKFAVTCAGGGWAYVGAMHDSFPHALELSKLGYNAFAIIYRPGEQTACEDLARALTFIFDHAEELGVDTDGYSLWGGSAGGRMAARLGSRGAAAYGGDDLPKPATCVIQYTGYSDVGNDPPTYSCVGTSDGIANYRTMQNRIEAIKATGTDAEIEVFQGLPHGFGLGQGTVAEGWLSRAVAFWERNMNNASPVSYTADTPIEDVMNDPVFGDYGRLIFPVNESHFSGKTLGELEMTWYNYINADKTVEICNYLKSQAGAGKQIFYDIYSDAEKAADPAKANTGLFFFRGEKNAKFAVICAGGGWQYVGAMHDSFPHALELSKLGYNAFAIIYRPGEQTACEDLARALTFIFDHSEELGVDTDDYSLWGGSAGAIMIGHVGSRGTEYYGERALPKPAAIIAQYGFTDTNNAPPTYACVGTNDNLVMYWLVQNIIDTIDNNGIPAEIEVFQGLPHGFGLGQGTVAEGWINRAVVFWEENR